MNILVTGANGQLGSELRKLSAQHPQLTFFFTDVAELDITNAEAIDLFVQNHQIEAIINCAAFTAVDKAESEPELCDLLNHLAPGYLAEAIEKVGGNMIQISTDYVFDGKVYLPLKEDMPTHPETVYGSTKLKGEKAVMKNCKNSVIIRTAWLYSSFGNNFVKTMLKLGKERKELGVIFDQMGTPTYAEDLAAAILSILEQGVKPGIYHFSNEGVCSWYDFTKAIHEKSGIKGCYIRPLHTEEYPTPAKRPHYSVLDKSKIKATYQIHIDWWQDSLQRCLDELLS